MQWKGRRQSQNVEDRRMSGPSGGAVAGLGGLGVLLLVVIGLLTGQDVTPVLNEVMSGGIGNGKPVEMTAADKEVGEFIKVTLGDTEDVWTEIFRTEFGQSYNPPKLILFKGMTPSACGAASAAMGPFYCPNDKQAFLDTEFFVTLERQLGAAGDFAAAYVVAHEIAHHVQNELGILDQVNRVRARSDEVTSNALSVRVELQADCLAGVWTRHAAMQFGSIDKGDIAEAMHAAARIGDDTLQRNAGQVVRPHTFTHGTSEQRQRWFEKGFTRGEVSDCDTFAARSL
jgi:predicted metalloprotease